MIRLPSARAYAISSSHTALRAESGETRKTITSADAIISCSRFHHSSSAEIPALTLPGSCAAWSKSARNPAAINPSATRCTSAASLRE